MKRRKDPDFLLAMFFLGFMTLILVVIPGFLIIDGLFFNPLRAEYAQQECEERGFDVYASYSGMFRTKAYGVKCEYVDYSRKQINMDINESSSLVIS